ncbi:hypothetical protein D9M71_387450 [compost metagenome]
MRATVGQCLGQGQHRVDAGHLGKHRDRLWPCRRHVVQGAAALERAGETHRLDAWVLDQRLANTRAEDHVEHPGRHARALGGTNQRLGHTFGRGHMPAVGLEHHRATGGQCGCGIATGRGKSQGEIAGAEHRHRADADTVLAQVRTRQRRARRQRLVDACAIEVAPAQHLGKQAQLPTGAAAFTLDTGAWQCRFLACQGDKILAQAIEFIGNGFQKLGTAHGRQAAKHRERRAGSRHRSIDLRQGGLVECARQAFAGVGIDAVDQGVAQGAALACYKVVSRKRHGLASLML